MPESCSFRRCEASPVERKWLDGLLDEAKSRERRVSHKIVLHDSTCRDALLYPDPCTAASSVSARLTSVQLLRYLFKRLRSWCGCCRTRLRSASLPRMVVPCFEMVLWIERLGVNNMRIPSAHKSSATRAKHKLAPSPMSETTKLESKAVSSL